MKKYTDSEKLILAAGFLDEMSQFIPPRYANQAAQKIKCLREMADAGIVPNATPANDAILVFRAEHMSLVSEILDAAKKWADENGYVIRVRGLGPSWFEVYEKTQTHD